MYIMYHFHLRTINLVLSIFLLLLTVSNETHVCSPTAEVRSVAVAGSAWWLVDFISLATYATAARLLLVLHTVISAYGK